MSTELIGQKNLLQILKKNVEENKLARFSIIVGERGSEADKVALYLADLMKCDCVVLSDVKVETMRNMTSQAYQNKQKIVYSIVSADKMSPNAKNAILKVVEEPPNKSYFVMSVDDLTYVPDTICSRARVYYMEPYTSDDIESYLTKYTEPYTASMDDILSIAKKVCRTPGEVSILLHMHPIKFYEYTESVVYALQNKSGAESLALMDNIAIKDEDEDKYDPILFLNLFQKLCSDKYVETDDKKYLNASFRTSVFKSELKVKGINKKFLFDSWCLLMRQIFK